MYGARNFGKGFVESLNTVFTGQEKNDTEWRINRGFAPYRSLLAALGDGSELPLGPDGKASLSQRAKLLAQGTLGVAPEVMFRLLSLGDTAFRKFTEGIELYQMGMAQGLEGQALDNFVKYPDKVSLEKARAEGRKTTFQEETTASKTVDKIAQLVVRIGGELIDTTFVRTKRGGQEQLTGEKKKGINGKGIADFLLRVHVPYVRTPTNLLMEALTYASPIIGGARAFREIKKGNPRDASQHIAKVIIGQTVQQFVAMAVKEGIISGPIEWNEDEERNLAYDQFPPSSINVSALNRWIEGGSTSKQKDDTFVSYNQLGLVGSIMGAYVKGIDRDNDLNGDPFSANRILRDLTGINQFSAISHMMDQSFLAGLSNFTQVIASASPATFERDIEKYFTSIFQAVSAVALPNTTAAMYRAHRQYLPDTRSDKGATLGEKVANRAMYVIKDRTFGLIGADFPVRVNWKGELIKQTPEGADPFMYQLFDITKSRKGEADPVSNEVYRLYEETGSISEAVGTPSFANSRAISVPDLVSAKDRRLIRRANREYTFMDDVEFMKGRINLTTEQMNAIMQVAGRERYGLLAELVRSEDYQKMSDKQKLEAMNEINEDFTKVKAVERNRLRPYSLQILDFIEQNYRDERQKD